MHNFYTTVLASGSKGNATLVSTQGQHFLIDIGISCRELTRRLRQCGVEPTQLTAVFITHEHSDHISGLATFLKKYAVPIYTSERTWNAIFLRLGNVNREHCHIFPTELQLGPVKVTSFAIPHDAADPHGYSLELPASQSKFTYLTDTGFVTDTVRLAAEGCETLVLEANHDLEMLKTGPYPPQLKQRILSTLGHLSNDSAGWLLAQLEKLPQKVILAHLSQENNRPSLAYQTIDNILVQAHRRQEVQQLAVASQTEIVRDFEQPVQASIFT